MSPAVFHRPAVFHGPAEVRAAVGRCFGPTQWLTVSRVRVDQFLAASGLVEPALAGPGERGVEPTADGTIRPSADLVPEMLVLSLSNYV
nr:hypothetical protein [Micromonospora sp. DSM 115978]